MNLTSNQVTAIAKEVKLNMIHDECIVNDLSDRAYSAVQSAKNDAGCKLNPYYVAKRCYFIHYGEKCNAVYDAETKKCTADRVLKPQS